MEQPSPATFWKKLSLQAAAILVALGGLVWVGSAGYTWWRTRSLISEARDYLKAGDTTAALSTAERTLAEYQDCVDAALVAVAAHEKSPSPAIVDALRRVATMRRDDAGYIMAWARSAMQWERPAEALQALAGVPEGARAHVEFHAITAAAHDALGRNAEAGAAYATAAQAAPGDTIHTLKHAVFSARHAAAPETAAQAAAALERLFASPHHGGEARRAFIALKIRQQDWAAAQNALAPLLASTAATIQDRISELTVLHHQKDAALSARLAAVKNSTRDAAGTAALMEWMNRHGQAAGALAWHGEIEPRIAARPEVARRAAEALVETKDWRTLRRLVDDSTGWLAAEHIRHAFAARAQRELEDPLTAQTRVAASISAAIATRVATEELLTVFGAWGWHRDREEMLWAVANRMEFPQWALAQLATDFTAKLSAEGMLRVHTRRSELAPGDDDARNEMIRFSLLLERGRDSAISQARGLAGRHPGKAQFAATHALALLKGSDGAEAAAAFRGVGAAQLADPVVAFYHGLALFAAAQDAPAKTAFEMAKKRKLFPEEKALLPPALRQEFE